MKRWLIYFILALQAFFAATTLAAPDIPPRPTAGNGIYVQDYAHVLTAAEKQQILSIGQDLDNKTTAQLAIVTVDSLNGQPIDEYALAILRNWCIGDKQKNNGALIVVAVKDRQSRIEVGYGLEGVLNDGLTGRIQDQAMLPYFRQGAYGQGIVRGYVTTASIVAKEAGVQLTGVQYTGGAQNGTSGESYPLWVKLLIGAGVILLLVIDNVFLGGFFTQMIIFALLRGGRGGGGGFGGGSGGGGGSSRRW